MSHAADEIASQPACWQEAAAGAQALTRALPPPGARVAAVGCGTSHNLARVYAALRERCGAGETDAFVSSEMPELRRYDHYVFFSRTGTTTETLQAQRAVAGRAPTTAVTAAAQAPLGREADHLVDVGFADERAVIQTRFFTSAVVLCRASLGEDVSALPAAAQEALDAPLPDGALDARLLTFLGERWCAALAEEATLKCRETAQVWAEAHQAMEYRHGPISLAEPGVLVWCLGPPPAGIADEVRATGASFACATRDPLAEVVRVQRLALARAERRGLDPDAPRHLRHSIVLTSAAAAPGMR